MAGWPRALGVIVLVITSGCLAGVPDEPAPASGPDADAAGPLVVPRARVPVNASDATVVARAPDEFAHRWVAAAQHPSGSGLVLHALVNGAGDASAMQFTLVPVDAPARTVLVGGPVQGRAPSAAGGDHYGGVAAAADGSVWLAWSERVNDDPTVTLARVPATVLTAS